MDGRDRIEMYSLAPFVFDKDHMTKAFISDEIKWVMKTLNVNTLDRDGIRCLLKVGLVCVADVALAQQYRAGREHA